MHHFLHSQLYNKRTRRRVKDALTTTLGKEREREFREREKERERFVYLVEKNNTNNTGYTNSVGKECNPPPPPPPPPSLPPPSG